MDVVKRYKKDEADQFARALAVLVNGLDGDPHDFLGEVAGEMEILNEWHGQFFTPQCISDMMASMSIGDAAPSAHRIKICEPCVGSGSMMIGVTKEMQARKFSPWNWWADCTDIDQRMFHAAYIQLSLLGVPGVIRHGNTLSLEQWEAELTPVGAMYPLREEFTTAEKAVDGFFEEPAIVTPCIPPMPRLKNAEQHQW